MKIVAVSDLHGHFDFDIPKGDVLVIAGDICKFSSDVQQYVSFNRFLGEQPHSYKLFIAGNHDRLLEKMTNTFIKDLIPNGIYLRDKEITIDFIKFYGSPWQPEFGDWAFNLPRGKALANKWKKIPKDTDILITHCPPARILDKVGNENVGCEDLKDAICDRHIKHQIYGHIHEAHGYWTDSRTEYHNVSVVNEHYELVHRPTVIDIEARFSPIFSRLCYG
jgi:Icc-related predicted phosphoesterase